MKPLILELVALALVHSACASSEQRMLASGAERPKEIRRFDLVPRGYDLNGFTLNPEWGWSFARRKNCPIDQSRDPATCSWRFLEDQEPSTLKPCNTYPMGVDLSTQWSTWLFGVTCSDSPLIYPGHVNWGPAYGAVTFEGILSWESYASDGDYNFVLDPGEDGDPGQGALIGVEINSGDFRTVHSKWFQDFKNAVHQHTVEVADFVGTNKKAIVTGLFGIDSEHMSARDMSVELHPVYAMAVETGSPEPDTDAWTFFVRNGSDEGFCSHRGRAHVIRFGNSRYTFRLPLSCAKTDLHLTRSGLCSTGGASEAGRTPEIAIRVDQKRREALVTVVLPDTGLVDGDLVFTCSGKPYQMPARRAPRLLSRPRAGGEHIEPTQHKVGYLRALDQDGGEMKALADAVRPQEECKAVRDGGVEFGDVGEMQRAQVECDAGVPAPVMASRAWAPGGPADAGEQKPVAAVVEKAQRNSPEKDYCKQRRRESAAARVFCAHFNGD